MKSALRSLLVAVVIAGLFAVVVTSPELGSAPSVAKVAPQRLLTYHVGQAVTPDTNLRSKSGYAAWEIDEFLAANTPLPALGRSFLAAERKYGVNARMLLAIALLESGYGTSFLAQSKNNLFGYNAYDRDPVRFASSYPSFQASISAVAHALKRDYLSASGRYWGGLPTLRGVNLAYASDVRWAEKIAYLANVVDASIRSLHERGLKFSAPHVSGRLQAGAKVTVKVPWKAKSGAVLPAGLRFSVRWTPVAVAENAIVAPARVRATAWTRVSRISRTSSSGKGTVTLTVTAPKAPGLWRLDVDPRDVGGAVLPTKDHPRVPATTVRVGAAAEATLALQATTDGRLVARVTASGTKAVTRSAAGTSAAGPTLEAWSLPLDPSRPSTELAGRALSGALRPGQSASIAFAAPATSSVVVVRLGGSVNPAVHAVPSVVVVTRKANGSISLAPVGVADPRTVAALATASKKSTGKARAASSRLVVGAGKQPGTTAVVVPAARLASSSGADGAAVPAVLVRTMDAAVGRSADPTVDRLDVAPGASGSASAAADVPGGVRLAIVAYVRPGGRAADPGSVVAAWVPVQAASGAVAPN